MSSINLHPPLLGTHLEYIQIKVACSIFEKFLHFSFLPLVLLIESSPTFSISSFFAFSSSLVFYVRCSGRRNQAD
jgi:hypothetical protein